MAVQVIDDAQWQRLLEEQVRGNARLFFRIAWRILRDTAAAEDVCQQAMLKAWSYGTRSASLTACGRG